jgi:chaperonin GroEL
VSSPSLLHHNTARGCLQHDTTVASRSYRDLLAMGVIDPAKVTRLALQNAGSMASLILSIDCMIAVSAQRTGAVGPLPSANPAPY